MKTLSVPDRHQLKIARDTLKMSDAGARWWAAQAKGTIMQIHEFRNTRRFARNLGAEFPDLGTASDYAGFVYTVDLGTMDTIDVFIEICTAIAPHDNTMFMVEVGNVSEFFASLDEAEFRLLELMEDF